MAPSPDFVVVDAGRRLDEVEAEVATLVSDLLSAPG